MPDTQPTAAPRRLLRDPWLWTAVLCGLTALVMLSMALAGVLTAFGTVLFTVLGAGQFTLTVLYAMGLRTYGR